MIDFQSALSPGQKWKTRQDRRKTGEEMHLPMTFSMQIDTNDAFSQFLTVHLGQKTSDRRHDQMGFHDKQMSRWPQQLSLLFYYGLLSRFRFRLQFRAN